MHILIAIIIIMLIIMMLLNFVFYIFLYFVFVMVQHVGNMLQGIGSTFYKLLGTSKDLYGFTTVT